MTMQKTNITSRAKNFTSSSIWKLMKTDKSGKKFGAPALKYIKEKKKEGRLGRQLQQEKNPRSASWGTFVQHRVTNTLLDTSCKPTKDIRRVHETISNWTGAEDYIRHVEKENICGEVKCFELDKFCDVYDAAEKGWEALKKECDDIAWQLVSNAILNKLTEVELCLYVPYQKELSAIKEEASQPEVEHKFQWIQFAEDDELPYLIEGMHYINLSVFWFTIPNEDIIALTNNVIMATKLLNE